MMGVDVHGVAELKVMVLDLKMQALLLDLINYNEPGLSKYYYIAQVIN